MALLHSDVDCVFDSALHGQRLRPTHHARRKRPCFGHSRGWMGSRRGVVESGSSQTHVLQIAILYAETCSHPPPPHEPDAKAKGAESVGKYMGGGVEKCKLRKDRTEMCLETPTSTSAAIVEPTECVFYRLRDCLFASPPPKMLVHLSFFLSHPILPCLPMVARVFAIPRYVAHHIASCSISFSFSKLPSSYLAFYSPLVNTACMAGSRFVAQILLAFSRALLSL
jgi:hypothetical protein